MIFGKKPDPLRVFESVPDERLCEFLMAGSGIVGMFKISIEEMRNAYPDIISMGVQVLKDLGIGFALKLASASDDERTSITSNLYKDSPQAQRILTLLKELQARQNDEFPVIIDETPIDTHEGN